MVAFVGVLVPQTGYTMVNCGMWTGSFRTIGDPSLAFVTKTLLVALTVIGPDALRGRKGTTGDA